MKERMKEKSEQISNHDIATRRERRAVTQMVQKKKKNQVFIVLADGDVDARRARNRLLMMTRTQQAQHKQ